ncbi:MAG: hypothetical protein ACE5IK_05520 [Acidobacteriota bacterium]
MSIILFDVEVYDENGKPIHGLTKTDFRVFERTREWQVYSVDDLCDTEQGATGRLPPRLATVDENNSSSSSSPAGRANASTSEGTGQVAGVGPGGTASTTAAPGGEAGTTGKTRGTGESHAPGEIDATEASPAKRRFVMYFDFSQLRPGGRDRALENAERWIRELMRPGDRLMMAGYATGTGLVELSGFSSDRTEILSRLHAAFEDRAFFDGFPALLRARIHVCESIPTTCDSYAQDELHHSRAAFRMLRNLLMSLDAVPGRKILFVFTQNGGLFPREYYFPYERRTYLPTSANNWSIMREVAADAVTSRTVVNTVNAGLHQLMERAAEQAVSTGWNFAERTGGDYNRAPKTAFALLDRATNKQRCVYRIGLVPRDQKRSKTQEVRVEVAGQVLPHRYSIQSLTAADRVFRRFAAVLSRPSTADAFPLYLAIRPVAIRGRTWRVLLQVGLSLESLFHLPAAGGTQKRWDIAGLLHQLDGSRSWEFADHESVPFHAADMNGLDVVHESLLDVSPGSYRLRAAVRDLGTEAYAASQIDLDLPHPHKLGVLGPACERAVSAVLTALPLRRSPRESTARGVTTTLLPCDVNGTATGTMMVMQTWLCTRKKNAHPSLAARGFVDRGGIPFYRLGRPRLRASGSCLQISHVIDTSLLSPDFYTYHLLVPGAGDTQIQLGTSDFTVIDARREPPGAAPEEKVLPEGEAADEPLTPHR